MKKEKVIIILCDTLRAKSLPHYGNERNTTPNLHPVIDKDFTIYKKAYTSGPWTPPSHLSLFTGLYPSQVMETGVSYKLNPVFKTLPDLFKESGYKTCAFSTNEIVSRNFGYNKGFDQFFQLWLPSPEGEELLFSLHGNNRFEKLLTLFKLLSKNDSRANALLGLRENFYKKHRSVLNDATPSTNRAMKLLKKYLSDNRDEKVFCFVNLLQTHNIYNPPRQTKNRFVKRNPKLDDYLKKHAQVDHYTFEPFPEEVIEYCKLLYEEEILYLDIVISEFIVFLKDNNLYDSSILIITSDHGEHFGENSHIAHTFSVFEPLIRIPLYIKWNGESENKNRSKDELVMLQDLYSTFIKLLNHWQPCPESSFDLTSSDKRSWTLSQLSDLSYAIEACKAKRQSFSLKDVRLEGISLNAYTFNDGKKIIENGKKILCYNLINDPGEKRPFPPDVEHREMMKKIKKAIA